MTKHGEATIKGKEYNTWRLMRQRCNSPKHKSYSCYGGRGIVCCAEWESYEVFLADMGRAPTSRHTLEREDNDGPYCKANCRWATPKEQAANRRLPAAARGEAHWNTILSDDDVRAIRAAPVTLKNRTLADYYKVSYSTIYGIRNCGNRKHVK